MSEMAKAARAAMKKKAASMSAGDPRTKVDASSWTPPEKMNTEAKTGLRPVSRRAFKKGGKVVACMGENAKQNAGKKPRKAAGGEATKYANAKVNRNVKDANAEFGKPHVGGYAKGGRKGKMDGGPMGDPRMNMVKPGRMAFGQNTVTPGMKKGGTADVSQDKKLIKKAFRQHETAEHGGKHSPLKLRKGGKTHKARGGYADRGYADRYDGYGAEPTPAPAPTQEEIDRYNAMLAAKEAAEKARREREEQIKKENAPRKNGGRTKKAFGGADDDSATTERGAGVRYVGKPEEVFDFSKGSASPLPVSTKTRKMSMSSDDDDVVVNPQRMPSKVQSRPAPPTPKERAEAYKKYRSKKPFAPKELSARDKLMNKLQGVDDDNYAKGGKTKGNYEGGTRPTGGRVARKDGGRTKKKKGTNINIVINTKPDAPAGMPPGPMAAPPMPPRPPMMPPGPPPGMPGPGAAPPMPMPPPGPHMGAPMGGPPGAPPGSPQIPPHLAAMLGRKSGGRVGHRGYKSYKDMDAGSGGGLGRLEKTEIQEHKPRKAGGRTYRSYKDMDAGAGGGLGRKEKTEIQKHK